MRASRRRTRFALVWLAALLTLAAGFPHVQCRCPDGRLKPYCLSFLFPHGSRVGCCCGGVGTSADAGCCLGTETVVGEEPVPTCCSRRGVRPAGTRPAGAPRVATTCCSKTLIQSGDFTPAPDEGGALADRDWADVLPPAGALWGFLTQGPSLPSWQAHLSAPPPTDLVTALQRLTI